MSYLKILFRVLLVGVLIFILVAGLWVWWNWERLTSVQTMYYPLACDMDRNDDCDAADEALFDNVLGECIDGGNYNEPADANGDGCITRGDKAMLFGNR